ncbi:hypothetical protein [Rothia nasimurium]|uniref:hypothetical protein n=1 Tax=Rothia nasimurium TaxID=85336 RepID=UPI003B9E433A
MTDSPFEPGSQLSNLYWVRVRIAMDGQTDNWAQLVPGHYRALMGEDYDDVGPTGAHTAEPADLEQQIRQQLDELIGAIREQASKNRDEYTAEDLNQVEELAADPQKFDDLIQKIVEVGHEELEAEQGSASTLASPVPEEEPAVAASAHELDEPAEPGWDLTTDLPVLLSSMQEVSVYETQPGRAQVYLLCQWELGPGRPERLTAVTTDRQGSLSLGRPLDHVLAEMTDYLPGLSERMVVDGPAFEHLATFSQGTDSMTLDPQGNSAALVELSMTDLPAYLHEDLMHGPVEAAPADRGWSLISADPATLAHLLEVMNVSAIVVEQTLWSQNLTFIVPADETGPEAGSVTEWMNRVMGTPDTTLVGTILTFSWGPEAKQLGPIFPSQSEAGDELWMLPGVLPEPRQTQRTGEDLEQLVWLYGLGEQAANRFENYVRDTYSVDALESALQALDLPQELLQVVNRKVEMESLAGYQRFEPETGSLGRLKESLEAYPNGEDTLSHMSRELRKRPWLIAADGAAQLGVSGALALWAARRVAKGQSGTAAMVAAATLGATGAAELALARFYQKLRERQEPGETIQGPGIHHGQLSITQEIRAQMSANRSADTSEQKSPASPVPSRVRQLGRSLSRQVSQKAKEGYTRFFGTD